MVLSDIRIRETTFILPALWAHGLLLQPFPSKFWAMLSELHPPWAVTSWHNQGLTSHYRPHWNKGQGCRQRVFPCSLDYFPLPIPFLKGKEEGESQAVRRSTSAVPTACRGEIMDYSIVTNWCFTGNTSSSNKAWEDQVYSHHCLTSVIQSSSPFISF